MDHEVSRRGQKVYRQTERLTPDRKLSGIQADISAFSSAELKNLPGSTQMIKLENLFGDILRS